MCNGNKIAFKMGPDDIIKVKINRAGKSDPAYDTNLSIGIRKIDQEIKKNIILECTKTMVARTYQTIHSFLELAAPKSDLWETPPKPKQSDLNFGFLKFKQSLQWQRFDWGLKAFMRLKDKESKIQVKEPLSLILYLTLAGLLQKEIAVKPYTGDDREGFVGNEKGFLKLHPYSSNVKNVDYFEYFSEIHNLTVKNFQYKKTDKMTEEEKKEYKKKNVIHIRSKTVLEDPNKFAVFALIHEASHKYSATKDVSYFYHGKDAENKSDHDYCGGDDNKYKISFAWGDNKTLVMEECVEKGCKKNSDLAYTYNADSVAAFIYHYGNC